ncbi:MAG TPA: hypothetical protein VNJ11_17385 [Bryobacteraceae bacterium]|nr:hypothetical protein [Bryobacteraceae bacterium]
MAEETTVTLTQKPGERLAGEVAVYGAEKQPAIQHVIQSSPQRPIVHMVCWDEEDRCPVDVKGRVTLAGDAKEPIRLEMVQEEPCRVQVEVAGDEKRPVRVRMAHVFENPHLQEHKVAPLDHTLRVSTKLAEPIHHALQMRTPLELRFCNPWHLASDYMVEVRLADSRLISIRITGATVASPQPCPEEKPCPPAGGPGGHP